MFKTRKIWREWQRGKWYGGLGKTSWDMLQFKELPSADSRVGIPTDSVLDALARLGHELARQLWQPELLLLRRTPPPNYEPALISDFLSKSLVPLVLVPPAKDLNLEWRLHEVQLDEAAQNLQLKTATGVDIGSVARCVRSIGQWLNAGAPKIFGVAQTGADNAVSIHLAAAGDVPSLLLSVPRRPPYQASTQLSSQQSAPR